MSTTQAMRPTRSSHKPNVLTLAIVGALHIAVIYALYLGLSGQLPPLISHDPFKVVDVVTPKPPPQQPHVPQPKLVNPTVPTIPKPDFPIDRDQGNKGITEIVAPPLLPTTTDVTPPVVVAARGIAGTHSTPDYPPLAVRLNQTGNVMLRLSIDEHGVVEAASVEKSSGYDSLDDAAVAWVMAHWRYEPATKDGKPFATTTNALVTFRLTGR